MTHSSIYFYGNKVSEYGLTHKRVDYRTLAKCFDAVLNNNIIGATGWEYWEQESGFIDYSDEIEALEEQIEELEEQITEESTEEQDEEITAKIDELREQIEELEEEQDDTPEIYQYYIVSDNAVEILKEANEIVFYNDNLDMYVWGVTHWGTSWDYVLTDIVLDITDEQIKEAI